jgi:3-phosphoshikimate 1-carboxyvinyltransferase
VALPNLIELVPLQNRVKATVTVPGSKSISNRALILAALNEGETILRGALWSEDTQVMVECLQELGFMITVAPDPQETCNRTITVYGKGGAVPAGGSMEQPLDLFVGNAGTAARFLAAFVCLGKGVYRLHGVPRMHERPQSALFEALRQLGYRIESANDKLPAVIYGVGPRPGKCHLKIDESSQFASALLLSAGSGGWQVLVEGENLEEASYVSMTTKLIEVFPKSGGRFDIEPDASSGSYFWAISRLEIGKSDPAGHSNVSVANWPRSGWQIDEQFPRILSLTAYNRGALYGLKAIPESEGGAASLPVWHSISRARHLGDSIMTAIVVAPFARDPIKFTDLGRLRVQECERVMALRTELTKCGAKVTETGDTLEVFPSDLHGAEIETYNDHRMAMCFAILGLKVQGIKIQNPACVKKTFPNFFQKLSAAPPQGLGAIIRDGRTGLHLAEEDLFAH